MQTTVTIPQQESVFPKYAQDILNAELFPDGYSVFQKDGDLDGSSLMTDSGVLSAVICKFCPIVVDLGLFLFF